MRSSSRSPHTRRSAFPLLATVLALGLAPTVALPAPAHAQIFKRLKRAAKGALVNETKNQIDRIISNAVKCVFDDPLCAQKAKDSGQDVVYTDDQGNVLTDDEGKPVTDAGQAADVAAASGDETLAPNTGVWTNYDFVPGEQVLFYDDYSQDNVGDFPRHLTFLKGNWELVEWRGRRLLRNTGPRASAIEVPLPDTLPSRFTIEFDVYFTHDNQQLVVGTEPPTSRGDRYNRIPGNVFQVAVVQGTGIRSNTKGGVESLNKTEEVGQKIVPFRIMVDGRYAKVYVGSHRVANVPNAEIHRGTSLYIENSYFADDKHPMYLGPIRVAAGGKDLYDVLAEKGRVATHGILFAVNSSVIRPESTPTLEEIARMLRDHPDLRLSIEGHTDSTGDAAYNLELSKRRAGSVRDYLTEQDEIDPSRLETTGYGETKPVADNGTPEGRQQNRRVELVKLDGSGTAGAGNSQQGGDAPGSPPDSTTAVLDPAPRGALLARPEATSPSSPGPSVSVESRRELTEALQRDLPSPATIRVGFKSPTRDGLTTDVAGLSLRKALEAGLSVDLSGERSIEGYVIAALIGASRMKDAWPCRWYPVRPGTNQLPTGELADLPRVFDTTSYSEVGRFVQADRYVKGDQYPQTDVFLSGDRLPPDLQELITTGILFGKVRVDWKRQSVLYLAVVPSHPDEAAATQVLPIAFLLNEVR